MPNTLSEKIRRQLFARYLHLAAFFTRKKPYPKVLSSDQTLDLLLSQHLSLARFGDGELGLLSGYRDIYYQHKDPALTRELKATASEHDARLLVAIPDVFDATHNAELYIPDTVRFWDEKTAYAPYGAYWKKYFTNPFYGDALLTRFYITRRDKSQAATYVQKLQQIWQDRDILFVEGALSRLGVGNSLFANAKTIRRIIAPTRHAYDCIDTLETAITTVATKDTLIILALGPTATVLARRLARKDLQALDLGHIDIEYEWLQMQATTKVPVPGKFINEIGDGRNGRKIDAPNDPTYANQIIARFDTNSKESENVHP
ncbi:MAG: GT-D fold domain-containing protein [Streptococcaceae bacterium]|jgi:glycosyltransferase family protein|nr:GT-D fold domain-containing protein [Streptococcaceae bacterium]